MRPDWRQALAYATVIGMEGLWLYALLAMLNVKVTGGGMAAPWLMLAYPFGFGSNYRRSQ